MKNILFIFILLSTVSCSKQDATLFNLNNQLGQGVFVPDVVLSLAPDMWSLENAQQQSGFVHAPYYYNDVKIYSEGGQLMMSCKVLNNIEGQFEMTILNDAFELKDRYGNIALYEKQ